MTPDEARRYVEVLDLYEGDLETLVGETRADKPGLTSALNPHLHDMTRGVATVREKITADAENMTRMIAGMREEWGVAYRRDHESEKRITWGWDTRENAERFMRTMTRMYVYGPVRRYVTEPEEIS